MTNYEASIKDVQHNEKDIARCPFFVGCRVGSEPNDRRRRSWVFFGFAAVADKEVEEKDERKEY